MTGLLITGTIVTIGAGIAYGLARAYRARLHGSEQSRSIEKTETAAVTMQVKDVALHMPAPDLQEQEIAAPRENESVRKPLQGVEVVDQVPTAPEQKLAVPPEIEPESQPEPPPEQSPHATENAAVEQSPATPKQEVAAFPQSVPESESQPEPLREQPPHAAETVVVEQAPVPPEREVAAVPQSELESESQPEPLLEQPPHAAEIVVVEQAPVPPKREVAAVPQSEPDSESQPEPLLEEPPHATETVVVEQEPVPPEREVAAVPQNEPESESQPEPLLEEPPHATETVVVEQEPVPQELEVAAVLRNEPESESQPEPLLEEPPHATETVVVEQEPVPQELEVAAVLRNEPEPEPEAEPRNSERPLGEPGRRAPQYRPPSRVAPAPQTPPIAQIIDTSSIKTESAAIANHAARIELRILFDRGGISCTVSLLPTRPQGSPEECTLSTATGSIELFALEEEWYQDVVPPNIGGLLQTGFVWTNDSTRREWLLAGRDIFVLAKGTTHRGFVSCPRLVLGREHAVLCATSRLPEVERILTEAGCASWSKWGEGDGAPLGWTVLSERDNAGHVRGLVPRNPLPQSGTDILDVLRPLPEIEIMFEDGVRLAYNSWLVGEPPTIRVDGNSESTRAVLIDGHDATRSEQGAYTAPGWDALGLHQVWCGSVTSKYSLVAGASNLRPWAAYSFQSQGRSDVRITICGPLVRSFADDDVLSNEENDREVIEIVATNPVLLGAQPGEIVAGVPRRDLLGARCVASPLFNPIWALPALPLHCDKESTRILLIGDAVAPGADVIHRGRSKRSRAVELWWRIILEASQKGLIVEPRTPAATDLWNQYKRRARELRGMNR